MWALFSLRANQELSKEMVSQLGYGVELGIYRNKEGGACHISVSKWHCHGPAGILEGLEMPCGFLLPCK